VALIINVVIVCWLVRGLNSRPLSQGLPAATKSYIWTYYDTVSAHFQGGHMLRYTLILLTTVLCKFNTLGTCFVKIIIVFDIIWKNKRHEIDNNRTIKHLTKLLLKIEPLKLNSLTVLFCVGQLLLS
jgi:hypothetical protein